MAGQYWGSKLGRSAEDDVLSGRYRQISRSTPVAGAARLLNSNNVYAKGALVLEMLKNQRPGAVRAAINRY